MAQVQHNKFTEIAFTAEEEELIRRSFTATQLQFLQNFRSAAAHVIVELTIGSGSAAEQSTSIQEHVYQRGKVDLISELLDDIAASQQRADDEFAASNQA